MQPSQKILVNSESAGQRLDVFLSASLKISRSQAQKMLDRKLVLLNGKLPKKSGEIVKAGDTAVCGQMIPGYIAHQGTAAEAAAEEQPAAAIKIVTETPDYIVVDKPWGLITHPTQAGEKNTLSGWVAAKYPEILKIGDDPARPGIVHRLDKEASGLLVIARTQKMFENLKQQFKQRKIDKQYLVLVHGKIEREEGEINFPIQRSDTADKMAALPQTEKGLPSEAGKEAMTEFTVERRFVNFTLLRVKIHTGRMHQIRAHMLAYNHPVVGDPLYFQRKQKRTWDKKCARMFLHCTRLGFADISGDMQSYESPLPEELKNFIQILKS